MNFDNRPIESAAIAAKIRRKVECKELEAVRDVLPFDDITKYKLDKGAVLRMAVAYLKMKQYLTSSDANALYLELDERNDNTDFSYEEESLSETSLILQALNGFLLVISPIGEVLYASQEVQEHIGVRPIDLIGKKLQDHLHSDDVKELNKNLIFTPSAVSCSYQSKEDVSKCRRRLFYVRMKCHLAKWGKKTKQTSFILMQLSGRVKTRRGSMIGMTCICRPMQSTPLLEIRLGGNMFISRHSLDMTFTFCDPG
ncbi:DgyrCDS11405 [Dimorphilus gyrociliatus]|uniref:DgyrCDS11405 n=1 Tax=Dimorphilus gyrociliatus TaxID=2664684 RepID=A0A7I8W498_9ANNE|nr:DgyrCDS11405 [Dimorphilus gyrociliatus]